MLLIICQQKDKQKKDEDKDKKEEVNEELSNSIKIFRNSIVPSQKDQ